MVTTLTDSELIEHIVGTIRKSGAAMPTYKVHDEVACFTEFDRFMRCLRIATESGKLRFNANFDLEIPSPTTPHITEQSSIFLTMPVEDARKWITSAIGTIMYNNIKMKGLRNPGNLTLDDIFWDEHLGEQLFTLVTAALVAYRENWPNLLWIKRIVDNACGDLDLEWPSAPMTDEEWERMEGIALSPVYDM
jgi:hypothetical protein